MKNILFVCTGNTCRSSMAEGFFKKELEKDVGLNSKYTCSSAGLAAITGDTASPYSISVLEKEWNIDINNHRATRLSHYLIENSYLVITMTSSHKRAIMYDFPEFKEKVYTLKEFDYYNNKEKWDLLQHNIDIGDPYGKSEEKYLDCAKEIKLHIDNLIEILKRDEKNITLF